MDYECERCGDIYTLPAPDYEPTTYCNDCAHALAENKEATMSDSLDLWGDDISVDVLAPLTILQAQVPALRAKTQGLLRAEVVTNVSGLNVIHTLAISATLVDDSKRRIFAVSHDRLFLYPCEVGEVIINSQEEFTECLKNTLRSDRVRGAINSLLAQSNEVANKKGANDGPV